MPAIVMKSAPSILHAVKAIFSGIAGTLAMIAAAGSAASAVEVGRQPDAADLRTLGMAGVSFKPYL